VKNDPKNTPSTTRTAIPPRTSSTILPISMMSLL
jgi:hypothetical protein